MATPKMTAMTPNSLGAGSFGFSPALLGQSPAAILKNRSPVPSSRFHSPGIITALDMNVEIGNANIGVGNGQHDESKKHEISEILRILGSRQGRVSEQAIERLARRMGLECYKETTNGITTLSLAAKIFLLDIDLIGYQIQRVALSFEKTPGISTEFAPQAAAIFHKDLASDKPFVNRRTILPPCLDAFSDNLKRLANTDRLSTKNLNCFTAITGMFESLNRIYAFEKETLGGELAALCSGNGRPQMHARGKVGLSVDYWVEKRLSPSGFSKLEHAHEDDRMWRVLIEVQECPIFGNPDQISPVRSSNQWVSPAVKKPMENNIFGQMEENVTDWLEPPLQEFMGTPGDQSQARQAPARFLARLDPPVVIPILDDVDATLDYASSDQTGLVTALLFSNSQENIKVERNLFYPTQNQQCEYPITHSYTLRSSSKAVYSRRVSEIPFSHPKELLTIFKILRQYAVVSTLLKGLFQVSRSGPLPVQQAVESLTGSNDMVDTFLQSPLSNSSELLRADISLSPEHNFGISIVMPYAERLLNLLVRVGENGEINIDCNSPTKPTTTDDMKLIETGLRLGEDIGLILEWIRKHADFRFL